MRADHQHTDGIREYFKRWPRFYYVIMLVLGPALFVNLSARGFLRKYPRPGLTLNIGSGPRVIASTVINVDIIHYEGVKVVADASRVPFPDASVARLIYDNVFEHVADPELVMAEASRLLEEGGYIYLAVPFLYPYHSSPSDHTRWTDLGLETICKRHNLRVVEQGVRAGPFSVLVLWIAYFLASVFCFGSKKLYWSLVNIFVILFFWVKIPDIAASYLPFAENFSSIIYVVAQKS